MNEKLILSLLVGAMAGVGLYTFHYAQGLAYFSNDPNACANCHLMREYLDSWQKSSHHGRAVCNDCHTPHALVPKLIAKAENGWRHSVKFTLGTFEEPLRIRPSNAANLRANCIGCHGELVAEIESGVSCVRCHAGVGHGK
ncbi:MAG: cytochrome c nitrite reductase small subunit [Bryobacteraceae bacterium]